MSKFFRIYKQTVPCYNQKKAPAFWIGGNMDTPTLYRKRLIPKECILLKDDHLFYQDSDILMTSWTALKPKPALHHGISCYYLKEGFKISRFYNHQNEFMYWYCDIISHEYDKNTNSYIFTDLIADVIIYPDGQIQVIDLDELAFALENELLPQESICGALLKLDHLLRLTYQGNLDIYLNAFRQREDEYLRQHPHLE